MNLRSSVRWAAHTLVALAVALTLSLPPTAFGQTHEDLMASMGIAAFPKVKAPDFTLNDLDGRIVRLSDHQGKVVLLNFWTTW